MSEERAKKHLSSDAVTLIVSIVLLIVGFLMLANPDMTLAMTVIIPAIAFIVYGVIAVIYYARKKKRDDVTGKSYVLPIVALAAGIVLLVFLQESSLMLPVVAGVWLVISAVLMLSKVSPMRGKCKTGFLTVLSIIILAIGVTLFIIGLTSAAKTVSALTGILFIAYGICNITGQISLSAAGRRMRKKSRVS